jgi:hypothetical protein
MPGKDTIMSFSKRPVSGLKPVTTISKIRVKPRDQRQLSLGNFTSAQAPKGFAVEVRPKLDSESVVTEVISLGTPSNHKFMLCIANYGDKAVTAKVREI